MNFYEKEPIQQNCKSPFINIPLYFNNNTLKFVQSNSQNLSIVSHHKHICLTHIA